METFCFEYLLDKDKYIRFYTAHLFRKKRTDTWNTEVDYVCSKYDFNVYKGDAYLFDQEPVAKGITAILADGTSSNSQILIPIIEVTGKYQAFEDYFSHSTKEAIRELNNSEEDISADEIFQISLMKHIEQEMKYLDESSIYYEISFTKNESDLKIKVRKFADSYLRFLKNKYNESAKSKITEPISNGKEEKDELDIDIILNGMFKLTTSELENLKNNLLNNGRQYISLTYIGTKAKLWTDLGRLLSAGIERNEISRIFSEYCKWQKSTTSVKIDLDSDEIYKKIGKKGTK